MFHTRSASKIKLHERLCKEHKVTSIEMPDVEKATEQFKNFKNKLRQFSFVQ
jgi:hypothetical protein